jgi:lysosomal alpha-mannosidase
VNGRQSNGSLINLVYSTPSCYLQEVNRANVSFEEKTDDFFPYASDPHAFWTGYFTSRPSLKYYVMKASNFLQACKQIVAGAVVVASSSDDKGKMDKMSLLDKVWSLAESVAVLQHHDAVSGTAKQHVTDDYSKRLNRGVQHCSAAINDALAMITKSSNVQETNVRPRMHYHPKLVTMEKNTRATDLYFCHELNVSACAGSESRDNFTVWVYNPLARDLHDDYIRIPVPTPDWIVRDLNNQG